MCGKLVHEFDNDLKTQLALEGGVFDKRSEAAKGRPCNDEKGVFGCGGIGRFSDLAKSD